MKFSDVWSTCWRLKGFGHKERMTKERKWKEAPRGAGKTSCPGKLALSEGPDTQPLLPPQCRLPTKWPTCSGSQAIVFQLLEISSWVLFISKMPFIEMHLMLATCLALTTCGRGAHYYYHNHRLPPACLTWSHYSCHPSPRRSLRHLPRFTYLLFGRWIHQMLNLKWQLPNAWGNLKGKMVLDLDSSVNMLIFQKLRVVEVGQFPPQGNKRKQPTRSSREDESQSISKVESSHIWTVSHISLALPWSLFPKPAIVIWE